MMYTAMGCAAAQRPCSAPSHRSTQRDELVLLHCGPRKHAMTIATGQEVSGVKRVGHKFEGNGARGRQDSDRPAVASAS